MLDKIARSTNALTTLRMAAICKNYLLNADVSQTRKELRRKSFAEAFEIMKSIAKQGVGQHSWKNAVTRMNTGFHSIVNFGLHPICTF